MLGIQGIRLTINETLNNPIGYDKLEVLERYLESSHVTCAEHNHIVYNYGYILLGDESQLIYLDEEEFQALMIDGFYDVEK